MKLFFERIDSNNRISEAKVNGKEVDLTTKEHTVAYALNKPENRDKLEEILTNAMYKIIPMNVAKKQLEELIQSLDSVSQNERDKVIGIIEKSPNAKHLTSTMATYYGGQVSDEKERDLTKKRGYYKRW